MLTLSSDVRKSLEEATQHYQHQVAQIGAYLESRGITETVASTRRLGYVADPLVGHDQYSGRLVIPYLTPAGVVDIRFRSVHEGQDPKYLSRPGVETTMYGVNDLAIDSPHIAICEGEFDALIASEMCGIPAVGVPGVSNWKSYYWRAFEDYDQVIVLCDGDSAGKDFGKKIANAIDNVTVVILPEGQDVNSTYLIEGRDGIRKRAGL